MEVSVGSLSHIRIGTKESSEGKLIFHFISLQGCVVTQMKNQTVSLENDISVRIVDTVCDFHELESDWNSLWKASPIRHIHQRFDWYKLWWQTYKSSHKTPYIVVVHFHDLVIGIAPFYLSKDHYLFDFPQMTLRLMGQERKNHRAVFIENQDLLIAKGYEKLVYKEIAASLKNIRKQWKRLVFKGISEESHLLKMIDFTDKKFPRSVISRGKQLAIELPEGNYDTFLDQQSKSVRSKLRGYKRLLSSVEGLNLRYAGNNEELQTALQSLVQIHCTQQRKSQMGYCQFDSARYRFFYEKLCKKLAERQEILIVSLQLDKRVLASACFSIIDDCLYCSHLSSVRGDGIRFSPQFLLVSQVIQMAYKRQIRKVLFQSSLCVNDEVKALNRKQEKPLYALECFQSKRRGLMTHTTRQVARLIPDSHQRKNK